MDAGGRRHNRSKSRRCGTSSSGCGRSSGRLGDEAAFIAAGDYHHHLGLNTWESRGAGPPPRNTTGLYHTAIRYPDRKTLADALRRVLEARIPISGASDHGVSEAIYLADPDGSYRKSSSNSSEPQASPSDPLQLAA